MQPPPDAPSLLQVRTSSVPVAPPVRRSFHDWLQEMQCRTGEEITISDFDGLDRLNFQRAYHETPMTEIEFQRRLGRCTMRVKLPPGS